jgi:hypothetical protein
MVCSPSPSGHFKEEKISCSFRESNQDFSIVQVVISLLFTMSQLSVTGVQWTKLAQDKD